MNYCILRITKKMLMDHLSKESDDLYTPNESEGKQPDQNYDIHFSKFYINSLTDTTIAAE